MKTATAATADLAIIALVAALHLCVASLGPVWAVVTYPLACLVIVRQLRGLENLVHEGSHYNWTRRQSGTAAERSASKRANDVFANLLAAFPVFSRVSAFREDHDHHHREIGTDGDPCFVRYVFDLDLASLDRTSTAAYTRGIVTRLLRYVSGWWTGPSGISGTSVLYGVTWHFVVVVVPLALAAGVSTALVVWTLYFGLPFFVMLPPFRFNAEAAKHDYKNNDGTVLTSTFSNVGPIHVLLHPHGDAYHLLHHLHPAIPHHRLREADRWLMENDPTYAASLRRYSILDAGRLEKM